MKKITLIFTLVLMIVFVKAQSVDEIVQKHLEKTGIEKVWNKLNSVKLLGKLKNNQGIRSIETLELKDGRSYGIRHDDDKKRIVFGFDGNDYWLFNHRLNKINKAGEEETARIKKGIKDFAYSQLYKYKEKGYTIELLEDENIQGEECFTLEINKGKKPKHGEMVDDIVITYINKETFLEAGTELDYIRGSFDAIMYAYYEDYKEVDGLMLPFKTTYVMNESSFIILVDSYELNTKVDPSVFRFEDIE